MPEHEHRSCEEPDANRGILSTTSGRARECRWCEEPGANKRCSGYSKVWYCSRSCQKSHWDLHIFDCNPRRPITTVHHLARAVTHSTVPEDLQTQRDYGFSRVFTSHDMTNLLCLYIGLLRHMEIPSKTLHQWRVAGRLIPEIKAAFEELPVDNRGGYYLWFLQNQWVLDESLPVPGDPILDMYRRAWAYSGGVGIHIPEQMRDIVKTWPGERGECFFFCLLSLSSFHPDPTMDSWIQFGFCTCDEPGAEMILGRSYQQLLTKCTFDEFCDAYKFATLFRRLKETEEGQNIEFFIPHLEGFLKIHGMHYSAWDLKQYIVAEDESNVQPAPSISLDYGFMNCITLDDREDLKKVYSAYFSSRKGDATKLHEACIQGKLFDHVGKVVKLSKRFKKLMKNPYPLPNY